VGELPTQFIVNRKTGVFFDRFKCLVAFSRDGSLRVYPPREGKNMTMDGNDCVMVTVHKKLRASISHPTFVGLVKRLADSEGIPLSQALSNSK
jgi:hypothetical protein